jgi:sodium transport system permease protein
MLAPIPVVARKEAVDSLRDTRSVISSLMYALMGPAVVFTVSMAVRADAVPTGMMSAFTLVAAFVDGMNVAMDIAAGGRERQSPLPLPMNPVRRRDIVLGKKRAEFSLGCRAYIKVGEPYVLGRNQIR